MDTAASIYFNDDLISSGIENMFVQYTIPLDKNNILTGGTKNKLSISFESPITFSKNEYEKYVAENGYDVKPDCQYGSCHVNHIRKMQSSYG